MLLYRWAVAFLVLLTTGCSAPMFNGAKQDEERPTFAESNKVSKTTVQALAFSPDGKYLASCHQYRGTPGGEHQFLLDAPVVKISQVEKRGGTTRAMFQIPTDLMGTDNTAFSFTRDGKILSALTKSGLAIWDVEAESLRQSPVSGPIAMAHDAKTVAVEVNREGSRPTDSVHGDSIRIVNGETGERLQQVSPDHAQASPWCFSPDGRRLLIECSEGRATKKTWEIWDLQNGRMQCSLAADNVVKWPSGFSSDGSSVALVTGEHDRSKVNLWDATTGRQQAALWDDVENLRCLAFSPDGRWVAIGCGHTETGKKRDGGKLYGQLRLWDIREGKEYASAIDRASWGITAVAFSPDSKTLVSGDGDGNIRFWEINRLPR